jgi:flavin-dependent dehydrogenase
VLDVIIAGGGPAGSIVALIMARAGARVLVVDRDAFPRDKLCGDTLNPGALRLLASLGLDGGPLAPARRLRGMLISDRRRSIRAVYGGDLVGLALRRRDLDSWLLDHAVRAGARFESGWIARHPLLDDRAGGARVHGLALERRGGKGSPARIPASMTVAADGRRSAVALALQLIAHPRRPRRWAYGTYATGIRGTSDVGEMHVRPGYYFGIAPLTDSVANVCVVTGERVGRLTPLDVVRWAIRQDVGLTARFRGAEFDRVSVMGPLAVEARAAGVDGLLLAGDAAGFVDPMTGDGLHLAMRGAVLAAAQALRTLETGDFRGAAARLAIERRAWLGAKLRFNRTIRALVGSRAAVELAGASASVAPGWLHRVVRYAGDAP